eukprot:PhM_4_TR9072/c0_g1_i1/m.56397/K14416/HBS1; elongation factor 1 alpha-like protein
MQRSETFADDGQTSSKPVPHDLPKEARVAVDVVEADGKRAISVMLAGHVDVGKSTCLGHLLVKLGLVEQRTMHKYQKESAEMGKSTFHFAWVLDAYHAERQRGITMDIATHYFSTPSKHVTILDSPGHHDLVPKVVLGAAQADAAILVVNANLNEFEAAYERSSQTKQHILVLRAMCITQVIVAVNKMDQCDGQETFERIVATLLDFFRRSGFQEKDITIVPISGLHGDNLVERSTTIAPWYSGPTLVEAIDNLRVPARLANYPLRMPISDAFKPHTGGIALAGRIECGTVKVGDKIMLQPGDLAHTVKSLLKREEPAEIASAGDNVDIVLHGVSSVVGLVPGMVVTAPPPAPKPRVAQTFEIHVAMLGSATRPLMMGSQVTVHVHTTSFVGTVKCVTALLDKKTGSVVKKNPKCIRKEESGLLVITAPQTVCVELATDCKNSMSRVVLREVGTTLAVGVIKNVLV